MKRGTSQTWYTYDSTGQRMRKVTEKGGLTEERLYLGGFEIYRKHQGTTVTLERETLHLMDGARRIAMVETKTVGTTTTPLPATVTRYQLDNHLQSASLELDETASVISYEEYYPYGDTSYRSARSGTEVSEKRYRYTGKEKDEETGLYYHGARYYAAWLGRWTAADPSGMVDGACLYGYVRNRPVTMYDPTGHRTSAPTFSPRTIPPEPISVRSPSLPGSNFRPVTAPPAPVTSTPVTSPVASNSSRLLAIPGVAYAASLLGITAGTLSLYTIATNSMVQHGNPFGIPKGGLLSTLPPPPHPTAQAEGSAETKTDTKVPALPKKEAHSQEKKPEPGRIYVTYTKYNEKTGLTYSGRTSMKIDLSKPLRPQAELAVALRDQNHHIDETIEPKDSGFKAAQLDKFAVGKAVNYENRHADLAYMEIRGREQQQIDYYGYNYLQTHNGSSEQLATYQGGAQTDTPSPVTENAIRGVAKDNPKGEIYDAAATAAFGRRFQYTGR